MPRVLYIHVGPKKTGTTAVQSFLRDHDNSVVIYPKVGLFGDGSHHNLVYAFLGIRERQRPDRSADFLFRRIAKQTLNSENNIVISSEEFAGRAGAVAAFAETLLSHIGQPHMAVRVLVTCREHFARAASLYNHRIRAPKGFDLEQRLLPDEFLEARSEFICYADLIRQLELSGLDVTVLNYDPPESWTTRFLTQVGFPKDAIPTQVEMKRVGLSAKALLVTLAINRSVGSREEREIALNAFSRISASKGAPRFIFSRQAAERVDLIFRRDRTFLRTHSGVNIHPPNLSATTSALTINQNELAEIATIARELGPTGSAITDFAALYLE